MGSTKIDKQEMLDKAVYFYYDNALPMELFCWHSLKDIVGTFMHFPTNIIIKHFPSQCDFVVEIDGYLFDDYVIPIDKAGEPCTDNLLHIHFNEDGEIDNEPYIVEYVKTKKLDDVFWFIPLTIRYVNEVIAKVVDLFTWYCKNLMNRRISEFDYDLRKNQKYVMMLCKYYGIHDLVTDLFFTCDLRYFKYIKHPDDIDTFYAKLDKFKDFVSNYKRYRDKHPMYIKGVDFFVDRY